MARLVGNSWKWAHLLFGIGALSVLVFCFRPGGISRWPNVWEEWSFLAALTLPPTFILVFAARGMRAGRDWSESDHRKLLVKEVRLALVGVVWGFVFAHLLPYY